MPLTRMVGLPVMKFASRCPRCNDEGEVDGWYGVAANGEPLTCLTVKYSCGSTAHAHTNCEHEAARR